MENKVRCPFCGGDMVKMINYGFKTNVDVTDEMNEQYESGELEPVFYNLICQECGGESPQFDTEGEAIAFMHGFNERMRELS